MNVSNLAPGNTEASLTGRWVGDINGTHYGPADLEIVSDSDSQVVDLRANLNDGIHRFVGHTQPGEPIRITLREISEEPIPAINGTLTVLNLEADNFRGEWEFDSGARGVAKFVRVGQKPGQASTDNSNTLASQLVIRECKLGTITLYRSELETLIEKIRDIFGSAVQPVIGVKIGDEEIRQFAPAFLNRKEPNVLHNCVITISDAQQHHVAVNLRANGQSTLLVQSLDERWTAGTQAILRGYLDRYSSVGTNWLREHWAPIIGVIILASIVVSASLPLAQRATFVVAVLLSTNLLSVVLAFFARPRVYIDESRRNEAMRQVPTIVAGLVTAAFASAIVAIFKLITDGTFFGFLRSLFIEPI
jgi:hypothetical protein